MYSAVRDDQASRWLSGYLYEKHTPVFICQAPPGACLYGKSGKSETVKKNSHRCGGRKYKHGEKRIKGLVTFKHALGLSE